MPYRYGVRSTASFEERLERYSIPEPNSGCWLWTGNIASGYGQFQASSVTKKKKQAHVASYEYFVGPIPAGMQLDHLCRVKCCVNPAHLEPVTPAENTRRGDLWQRKVTHCPRGHLLQGDNLIPRFLAKGQRVCRECDRMRKRVCQIVGEAGPTMEPQNPHQL